MSDQTSDQTDARPQNLDAYHHPRHNPARSALIDDIVLALHTHWQANPHKTLGQIVLSLPTSPHVDVATMGDDYALARLAESTR